MKVLIRNEEPSDFKSIYSLNSEAFGQPDEAELISRLRQEKAYIPELALVAEYKSLIVGHIVLTKITISGSDAGFLALAPMAVSLAFQNKGIGSQLVNYAIERARQLGFRAIIVLGHPDYYPKFGFIKASLKGISSPFDGVPDEAFMVLELVEDATNGISGIVEYAKAFESIK